MKKITPSKSKPKAFVISKETQVLASLSPQETYAWGVICGKAFPQGVMALFGDLGAGKTVFAKGVAHALGVADARKEVLSPSFTIVREHEGDVPFLHVDLYRVSSREELEELHLREYFERGGVALIEWPEKALEFLPSERLEIYFEILGPKKRRISVKRRMKAS